MNRSKQKRRKPGQQWQDISMAEVQRQRTADEAEFIESLARACFGDDWRERFYGERVK